jgi:O-succinylbenzoate synthase
VAISVIGASVTPFKLKCKRPLPVRGQELWSKEGAVLELHFSDGLVGLGEFPQLPGMIERSWNEQAQELAPLLSQLPKELASFDLGPLAGTIRFAFEGACQWAHAPGPKEPASNLLASNLEEAHQILKEKNPACLKLKISKLDSSLRSLINSQAAKTTLFRLDANQRLSSSDLKNWWSDLDQEEKERIEYFEEPCTDMEQLSSEIPTAIDESLQEYLSHPERYPGARALIIRPSIMGIEAALAIHTQLPLVVSSCFESRIGTRALWKVVELLGSRASTFHGLSHLDHFETSLT